MKVSFLFGAGAESSGNFNIQNGNDFIINTIYKKNKKYKHMLLDKFSIKSSYLKSLSSNKNYKVFINNIFCEYILQENRSFKISSRAISDELAKEIELEKYLKTQNELKKFQKRKFKKSHFSEKIIDIVRESKKVSNSYVSFYNAINNLGRSKLKKKLNDFGLSENINFKKAYSIVKVDNLLDGMFHNLIDPTKYETPSYYKVFYYYWKCFFAIVDDINNESKLRRNLKTVDDYLNYVLELKRINDVYKLYDNFDKTYYGCIKKKLLSEYKESVIVNAFVTTNYTNFISFIDKKKFYNIHGTLDIFESSKSLEFYNIKQSKRSSEEFFPFIMGVSNVKPIINYNQIKTIYKAFNKIYSSDFLIIIGYGLNDSDHHITEMIKEFTRMKDKRIIYVGKGNLREKFENFNICTNNVKFIDADCLNYDNEKIVESIFENIF